MFDTTKRLLPVILASVLVCTACESDEFEDAPSASAADEPAASASEPAPNQPQGNLPANHPPVGGSAQGSQQAPKLPPARKGSAKADPGTYGKTGALRWEAPESWEAVAPSSSMRKAQYQISGQAGESASLAVFYFGPNSGGSIDANLQRWVGQIKDKEAPAERSIRTVNGLKVHLVDVSGTYSAGMGMGGGQAKADQRLLGAIAETPRGNFFFKLVGPRAVVDAHEDEFDSFVASFQTPNDQE